MKNILKVCALFISLACVTEKAKQIEIDLNAPFSEILYKSNKIAGLCKTWVEEESQIFILLPKNSPFSALDIVYFKGKQYIIAEIQEQILEKGNDLKITINSALIMPIDCLRFNGVFKVVEVK